MLENEMDFENRIIAPEYTSMEDSDVETSLRPKTLSEYIGQEKAKENLSIFMQSAKMRGEALDHVLLYGPPGLGKTTLAGIVANEMGVNLRVTSGPATAFPVRSRKSCIRRWRITHWTSSLEKVHRHAPSASTCQSLP